MSLTEDAVADLCAGCAGPVETAVYDDEAHAWLRAGAPMFCSITCRDARAARDIDAATR